MAEISKITKCKTAWYNSKTWYSWCIILCMGRFDWSVEIHGQIWLVGWVTTNQNKLWMAV